MRQDDTPIDKHPDARQGAESGTVYVVKDFRPPLMRGDRGVAKISLDAVDAYKMNPRYDRKLWIGDFLRDVVYLPSW
jgi:hypothetical protein